MNFKKGLISNISAEQKTVPYVLYYGRTNLYSGGNPVNYWLTSSLQARLLLLL